MLDLYPNTTSKIADKSFSTGRTTWNSLDEQLAMQKVFADPLGGARKVKDLTSFKDPNITFVKDGWSKYARNINGIEVHFNYNPSTGQFLDFKFID